MNLESIPVINVSPLLSSKAPGSLDAKATVAAEIRHACEQCGFFYVKHHNIEPSTSARVFERARQLFEDLPLQARMQLAAVRSPLFRGYIGEAEPLDTCGDGATTPRAHSDEGHATELAEAPLLPGAPAQQGTAAVDESGPAGARGCNGVCGGSRAPPWRPRETKQSFTIGAEEFVQADGTRYTSPMHGPNQWPLRTMATVGSEKAPLRAAEDSGGAPLGDAELWTEWRADVAAYWDACLELSRAVARGLALSLDLEESFFEHALTHPCAQMVFLRYRPPNTFPEPGTFRRGSAAAEQAIGCGSHTDCGFLTILAQDDVGGLEVKHADGRWIEAPPLPGTFVVNLGDMAQRWSDDRYKSTRHRVTYKKVKDVRYSVPFFCNCNFETPVECIAFSGGEGKYTATSAGAYIMEKLGLMRV